MSKKILIVSECFYPEEFKINEVALDWVKKGYSVEVLTSFPTYPAGKVFKGYKNKFYALDDYNGIKIHRVRAITGYNKSLFKKILKYFSFMILGSFLSLRIGKKYDYILGFNAGPLTAMVPAILLKKFYKKTTTLWVQDVWPDSVYAYGFKKTKFLAFFLNRFVRFVYKHTDNFAVSCIGFKDKIIPFLSESRSTESIKYLPNWADNLDKTLDKFEFSKDKKIHFTFAGNVGTVQNLDNIIKSFSSLPKDLINKAQLNIIGDGSYAEHLKILVKDNNFTNIVFWGRKPREEIYKYLKASDFLIVSLINKEIFSLTVPAKTQTYIAANKPILAILNGDVAKIIKNNNLGFTASPDNLEQIEGIFHKAIITTSDEIIEFTKNCEAMTNKIFNKNKNIENLLKLLINP